MSVDDLAATLTSGLAKVASVLPSHRDFIEKLPVQTYAADRQDRIDQHVGIGEVDAEGKLLRVNARSCALTGYSSEEMLGRSIFDETYGEDAEADREQFRRQVAGEVDRYTIEKRIRRKDGTYVWTSITSSSVRDADGRFLYALRILHDLTERRRVEDALAARIREQTALYQFTDRLQRAESLDDVYEPALDAILGALQCSRASILLRDSSGMMRFVAWRGLSEPYRRAVDGHSPWSPDVRDAQPICVDDVARAAFPEPLKRAVIEEGIHALAFIPLQLAGRLIGKFMAYYDVPHPFTRAEIDLAFTIARQLGFSIDRKRAEQAAHRLETQQRVLVGELNHRVKNNMQMLQSLLAMAARQAGSAEAREVLEEASGRVTAMAAAHRVLYTTPDATRFNAHDFLNTICESTKQTFAEELDIDCDADSVELSNDAAMPLALIANELLTNAVKHGLNGRKAGTIRVRLTREDDSFLFYVEDDGPGFHLQSVQRRSSGLALVQGLARQLRGEFEVTRTPATRCSVRFQ